MRAVTHILNGKDEKAKAIRNILDLFLPKFSNLKKGTPILIDLPEGLSPGVIGTGVSVLTDLYFDIEIKKERDVDKGNIIKGIYLDFERFLSKGNEYISDYKIDDMQNYKLELERLDEFSKLTPKLFMACVILETYKRCGLLDFSLFRKANRYHEQCSAVVELFLQKVDVNDSVISNPIFGCMEHCIKGDGDFILNGDLYDIKTAKSIEISKDIRRQLMFYYLMNHISYIPFSGKTEGTKFDISKLYIYKARHGVSVEVPVNLRGASPWEVMKTITEIEIDKISPSEGLERVMSMLKEELDPKLEKAKTISGKRKKESPNIKNGEVPTLRKKKPYVFKIKKIFICNETKEMFDSVRVANEKHGYSKNAIYRQLENGGCTTSKDGCKYTWRVMYKIV